MDRSDGVLSDPSGSTVIKPCKKAEISFYESTSAHPAFSVYIPRFMGTLSLLSDAEAALAAAAVKQSGLSEQQASALQDLPNGLVVEKAWAPSGGGKIATDSAIMLENVAEHYMKPNILDVKLGARLWADDAPPAKREKMERESTETTSKTLGLRIAGMRIWQGQDHRGQPEVDKDGYQVFDKHYGRQLTPETIHEGFEIFFNIENGKIPNKSIKKVIKRFVADLEGLRDALELEESRMYSSSLLFVYEGDWTALQEAFVLEKDVLATHNERVSHQEYIADETYSSQIDTSNTIDPTNEASLTNGTCSPPLNALCDCLSSSQVPRITTPDPPSGLSSALPVDFCDPSDLDSASDELHFPRIQALKLIDFAHAQWTPGQGPDENLLYGIKNVIQILTNLLSRTP